MSETKAALNEGVRKSYSSWPERLEETAGWGRELMTWKWEQVLAAAAVKRREELLALQPQGRLGALLMRFAALGEGASFLLSCRILQISPWGLLLQYLEFIIQR